MRHRHLWLGALAVFIWVGVCGNAPAAAHGDPEFSGVVGPFAVETFDEQIVETGVLYTVIVNDSANGLPVRGATVEVNGASAARQVGPLVDTELGGAYQVLLPTPIDGEWRITVRISLAGDAATFSHDLVAAESDGGGRGWRNAFVVVVVVIAAVAALGPSWSVHGRASAEQPKGA